MVSAVRSRPNHYEMLGLAPTASSEEIAQAFAREIGMFRVRPMGGVAQVSIAYETLRDPIKRQAYDASLGLNPEPKPLLTLRGGGRFIGSSPGEFFPRPAIETMPSPAPRADPPAEPEPAAEPRTASFIAASLRDPPKPQARHDPAPAPMLRQAKPKPDAFGEAAELRLADAEDRPVDWTRPVMAGGAVVAAVVLVGALAGWRVANEPQRPEPGLTAELPAPKRTPITASAPPPAPERTVAEAEPHRIPRAAVAAAPVKRGSPTPAPLAPEDRLSEVAQFVESPAEAKATEPTAVEAPAVETTAALPLSNAAIARTIQRIGYACGQVASTTAAEGATGVFKVTCTSGHSYQASPVRGRYHFRRLASH